LFIYTAAVSSRCIDVMLMKELHVARAPSSTACNDPILEAASGTGVYEWRPALDRLVWSPGLLRIYDQDEAPRGECGFSRFVHPEDRVRVEAETSGFLSGDASSYSHQFRIVRPDGSVRFVLDRGVIERDQNGRVQVIRGMNIDLGEAAFPPRPDVGADRANLRDAELEALYLEAPLGLAKLDIDLRFVRINKALAEINGYSVDQHLGRRVWDLLPDLRDSAEPALRQVIETGLPLRNVAIRGETPARPGVIREWCEHFYPLRTRDGVVRGIGIICEEVTDRVAAERALVESEARLAAALRAGRLGVHEFDPGTGSIKWDPTVRAIWGVPADEPITYETFAAGIHPDDIAVTLAAVEAALEPCGPGRYEAVFRVLHRSTSDSRWVRADGDVAFNGGTAVRLVGTVQDVTAQKEAEAAILESEQRFRSMADNAPMMVWVTQADGACSYLNPAWYEFTGQAADKALGFGWLTAVHPDDAAHSESVFREATMRRQAFRLDYRLRRADGVYRWVVDSARPRLSPDGEFLGFIGSVIDITDHKVAEETLRAANETFRQLVECSPFGIYAVDADFRLVQVSDGARKVFENVHPLIGRDFADVLRLIWPEPFASEAIAHFRHTMATGEPYHAPGTVQRRADIDVTEAYDWKLERIVMPDGRAGVVCHFYDLSERRSYEEKIQYLMREVNHRAKNMLSLVAAVARQTASAGTDDFLDRFSERLRSLAASQDLLVQTEWRGTDLAALVRSQLLHFRDLLGRRILLDGPPVEVSPQATQALGMALHELATNAAKYGALSNAAGRVEIAWRHFEEDGVQRFSISWTEKDGPAVKAPVRKGFGGRVVGTLVERALSSEVTHDYPDAGVVWTLRCLLSSITGPEGPTPWPVTVPLIDSPG
jgi:PAS domain S-box-containing protein